jgi:hypothetical protein
MWAYTAPFWVHHNSKTNNCILLFPTFVHLQMKMKHCTKFKISPIDHLRRRVSASNFTSSTSLGSTITIRKNIVSSLGICTSTNDNEYITDNDKVSSLYDQPSKRRRENKMLWQCRTNGHTCTVQKQYYVSHR